MTYSETWGPFITEVDFVTRTAKFIDGKVKTFHTPNEEQIINEQLAAQTKAFLGGEEITWQEPHTK